MNVDELILTIVHQANTIREMAAEIARLRRLVAEATTPPPPDKGPTP